MASSGGDAGAGVTGYAALDVGDVDQRQVSTRADLVPRDGTARRSVAHAAAFDAVVYGLPAAYQYAQMCRQYAETGVPTGQFVHERRLAAPGFAAFRVPNVDTLYSNAWLDLREGPVAIDLPDFGDRYFTLNLLDAFGNASNISRRTVGPAREVWLVAPGDDAGVPDDAVRLRVASRLMWVLMRIQVRGDDLAEIHRLQDSVLLRPVRGGRGVAAGATSVVGEVVDPDAVVTDWEAFFHAMDGALRLGGVPADETALVRRFAVLGLAGTTAFRPGLLDEETRAGAASGFAAAMGVIDACRPQLGEPVPAGWTKVCDKGAHGANFLSRAVMNHVGLAANVVEENTSFNTYVDGEGRPLDGAAGGYLLTMERPPPAGAFWSVTLYDDSGFLVPSAIDRSSVGSATPGLLLDVDGSVTVSISAEDPGVGANWLPAPRGRFFLVLRIYEPLADALSGAWLPGPVRPVA